MNDAKIKAIIKETVSATVLQLKAAGLLRDKTMTAYQKTEVLLFQYPKLKEITEPYAQRVVQEVDACLAEAASEPYVDVIRLYYFEGLKNLACANALCCGERTARRVRTALVEQFSVRLASDDFIRELLM